MVRTVSSHTCSVPLPAVSTPVPGHVIGIVVYAAQVPAKLQVPPPVRRACLRRRRRRAAAAAASSRRTAPSVRRCRRRPALTAEPPIAPVPNVPPYPLLPPCPAADAAFATGPRRDHRPQRNRNRATLTEHNVKQGSVDRPTSRVSQACQNHG